MEPFTKALLDRAKSLVGGVLRDVHYDDRPTERVGGADSDAGGHRTHVGVDLLFDEMVMRVYSSDEFTDGTFELALHDGPAPEGRGAFESALLVDEAPWRALFAQPIVSSKVHWVDSPYVAFTKRRKAFSSHHFDVDGAVPFAGPQAPLALELHFANGGRVLLVSGSRTGEDHAIVETGAGISVLWDADTFALLVPRISRELKKSW
jgi:hypothetical protein